MFCTNCGDEMRDTDKFCASCGTPAAPRKKRTTPVTDVEGSIPAQPEPAPIPAPAAEVFSTPAPEAARPVNRPEIREQPVTQRSPTAAPVTPPAEKWPPAVSEEEERRVLIEAEEIASARGMMPIEALPDPFPPDAPEPRRVAATITCPTCGKLNPETSAFCESCGRKLGAAPAAAEAPAADSPGWLYDVQPAAASAPEATVPTPITAVSSGAAPATAAAAAPEGSQGFSYYYDDNAGKAGSPKLLFVLLGVLVLGVIGLFYIMLRPSPKSAGAGNISVSITPTEAKVEAGNAFDFTATVRGSGDTDVNWSVREGSSGGKVVNRGAQAQGGEVSNMAVYVAPSAPGTYHVVAASKADPQKTATAEVTVSGK